MSDTRTHDEPQSIQGIYATEAETLRDLDRDALDEYRNDRDGT